MAKPFATQVREVENMMAQAVEQDGKEPFIAVMAAVQASEQAMPGSAAVFVSHLHTYLLASEYDPDLEP